MKRTCVLMKVTKKQLFVINKAIWILSGLDWGKIGRMHLTLICPNSGTGSKIFCVLQFLVTGLVLILHVTK